jgi:hypothetical protein
MDFSAGVVGFVTGLFPAFVPPDWLTNLDGTWNTVMDALGGISPWVSWSLLFAVVSASIGVWAACVLWKATLRLLAFIPEFGGAG